MGLVDTLDFFPESHPGRGDLEAILVRLAAAIARVQDPASGVWWEVLDQGGRQGNYLESSASAMFVYGLAKAVAKGYLPAAEYRPVFERGFDGLQTRFVQPRPDGGVDFNSTVSVGGLGGTPYRNGTYEYYLSEPVVTNDAKGVGPLLLASLQLLKH
jgi:unsaturated rhamnogalacturonyl hydrolase